MTQSDILEMFRRKSESMSDESVSPNAIILELAQLLADSRGRLSKENFDALIRIGGALYKTGRTRFDARSDIADIMKASVKSRRSE